MSLKCKFQVLPMHCNDRTRMEELINLKVSACSLLGLPPEADVQIPINTWEQLGGHPNSVPASVTLVHPESSPRLFDEAKGEYVNRTCLSHQYVNQAGKLCTHSGYAYCGREKVHLTSTNFLEDVTCPDCLKLVAKTNTNH